MTLSIDFWLDLRDRRDAAAEEFLDRCDLRDKPLVETMLDNADLDSEVSG